MVLLAITPKGLADAIRQGAKTGEPIWCGAEAVADEQFAAMVPGTVTRFTYGLIGNNAELIEDAIGTIAEHHPGQSIWVEAIHGEA